ncbi:AAA family ATPase [Streptomyces sp. PmtG]
MTASLLHTAETPVLVGRTEELRSLTEAVARTPSVALVEGEAGIGKTRLIREALRHPCLRGRHVLVGSCRPLREPFPYGPVFDLLRHLSDTLPAALSPVCGALRPYLPELADRLPCAPDPLHDPRARRHRLFRAVRALLDALGPAVVVVEDLHWADDGTRDLLRFLVDEPPRTLSAVLSFRREELPGAGLPLGRAYHHPPGRPPRCSFRSAPWTCPPCTRCAPPSPAPRRPPRPWPPNCTGGPRASRSWSRRSSARCPSTSGALRGRGVRRWRRWRCPRCCRRRSPTA